MNHGNQKDARTRGRLGSAGRKKSGYVLLSVLCLFSLLTAGCGFVNTTMHQESLPLSDRLSNNAEVIKKIRHGLKEHASVITIRFEYGSEIFDELNAVVGELMEAALDETGEPDEGDYIRYQYGGYTWESSYLVRGGRYAYTLEITPVYYDFLTQEQETEAAAETLLDELGIRTLESDYDKTRTLYAWMCSQVSYDRIHQKNPYYHLCSTAYAALVRRTATCQGYCTALCRLLRMAGIGCRIVSGATQQEGTHAWLLIRIDESWYLADPTWDAGKTEWDYFLLGAEDTSDRVPDARFQTEAFLQDYPQSNAAYIPPEQ